MEVGRTILEQIMCQDIDALTAWGAHKLMYINNGVSFCIHTPIYNEGNVYVKITLNSMDTYDIEVIKIIEDTKETLKTCKDIYWDMLIGSLDELIDDKTIIFADCN